MANLLQIETFGKINLSDAFFDTLREDYPGFDTWFESKSDKKAYVIHNDAGAIEGFLYPKIESGPIEDVEPPLGEGRWLKVGTFKIDGHGTKLGERFFKKIFDLGIENNVDGIYVTIFPKHEGLIRLFDRYGFEIKSQKLSGNGEMEMVMVRDMRNFSGDITHDFPFIHAEGRRKWLLAIYPEFHTQLFPDSILKTESINSLRDLSHTNSIHKVYICQMPVESIGTGDIVVMYRTKDEDKPAEYSAVATSIGVVEDVKRASSFATEQDFVRYCQPYSVFDESKLKEFYADRQRVRVVKFTYNAAMNKRLIRKRLIEEVGLERDQRWGFFGLTDTQFESIVALGEVNENLIVN
jgi:hypothetical protein